jgi:hypothetical protein
VVLILGWFTADRKAVLDALRHELRQTRWARPHGDDIHLGPHGSVHHCRYRGGKSIPQELQAIVPNFPSVPVQPLLLTSEREYGMFEHFKSYPWVLDTYYYDNLNDVLASVEEEVISPAEAKVRES